jgi:hypothetical protein
MHYREPRLDRHLRLRMSISRAVMLSVSFTDIRVFKAWIGLVDKLVNASGVVMSVCEEPLSSLN